MVSKTLRTNNDKEISETAQSHAKLLIEPGDTSSFRNPSTLLNSRSPQTIHKSHKSIIIGFLCHPKKGTRILKQCAFDPKTPQQSSIQIPHLGGLSADPLGPPARAAAMPKSCRKGRHHFGLEGGPRCPGAAKGFYYSFFFYNKFFKQKGQVKTGVCNDW